MQVDTYEKLLTMALLQKQNLPNYKTDVGATGEEITSVTEAAENLQYIKDFLITVEADKMTLTQIKNAVYNGDAVSDFGGFPAFTPPHALVAGLKEQFQKRNARYKLAEGYTKEIGIALGIEENTQPISPDSVKPTFEAFPAQTGYEAALVIANRGKSDMWRALGRKMNSEKWGEIGSATGKSADVSIAPTTEGQPERMEIKIQLYKSNEPYGQASDPQYVTFNP